MDTETSGNQQTYRMKLTFTAIWELNFPLAQPSVYANRVMLNELLVEEYLTILQLLIGTHDINGHVRLEKERV